MYSYISHNNNVRRLFIIFLTSLFYSINTMYFFINQYLAFFILVINVVINIMSMHSCMEESKPKHLNSYRWLDLFLFIRILACTMVLVMHSKILKGTNLYMMCPAWFGMIIFFTLSGYLISDGFISGKYFMSKDGICLYLRNRILRLYPTLIFIALLVIFIQDFHKLDETNILFRIMSCSMSSTSPATQGTGAFWSLSTEFHFYLMAPFLVWILSNFTKGDKFRILIMMFIIALIGVLIRYLLIKVIHIDSTIPPVKLWLRYSYCPVYSNIDSFSLGMLANLHKNSWDTKIRNQSYFKYLWIYMIILVWLTYFFVAHNAMIVGSKFYMEVFIIYLPMVTSVGLYFVFLSISEFNAYFKNKKSFLIGFINSVLIWGGVLTYPLYLVHSSILHFINSYLELGGFEKFSIFLIISIIAAEGIQSFLKKSGSLGISIFQNHIRGVLDSLGITIIRQYLYKIRIKKYNCNETM